MVEEFLGALLGLVQCLNKDALHEVDSRLDALFQLSNVLTRLEIEGRQVFLYPINQLLGHLTLLERRRVHLEVYLSVDALGQVINCANQPTICLFLRIELLLKDFSAVAVGDRTLFAEDYAKRVVGVGPTGQPLEHGLGFVGSVAGRNLLLHLIERLAACPSGLAERVAALRG